MTMKPWIIALSVLVLACEHHRETDEFCTGSAPCIATVNGVDQTSHPVQTIDAGGGCVTDTMRDTTGFTWTLTYARKWTDDAGIVWYSGRGCPQWRAICDEHPTWRVCSDPGPDPR